MSAKYSFASIRLGFVRFGMGGLVALICVLGMMIGPACAGTPNAPAPKKFTRTLTIREQQSFFEQNEGQVDSAVRYFARAGDYVLFLTERGAVLSLAGADATRRGARRATVSVEFIGADPAARIEGTRRLPGRINYFVGNDPKAWRRDVPIYAGARYDSIYPGIDAIYYDHPEALEFDLRIAAGADPKIVRLALHGARRVRLDNAGDLVMTTAAGRLKLLKPVVHEEFPDGRRESIDGRYVMFGSERDGTRMVGFAIARRDARATVVVDPQFVYSSFFGGSGQDFGGLSGLQEFSVAQNFIDVSDVGFGVATGGVANTAYVAGMAYSTNFPFTKGAFQTKRLGALTRSPNAFVAKFDTTKAGAASLIYATFFGGSGNKLGGGSDGDQASGIAVDGSGDAYVVGTTYSTNLPTTNTQVPGGTTFNGSLGPNPRPTNNGFAIELNPAGNGLIYSTYINGADGAVPSRVAIEPGCASECEAFISGSTTSDSYSPANFPVTASTAYQSTNPDANGNSAAFLLVISGAASGTPATLAYGTFLGGSGNTTGGDVATGIAVDSDGLAYMTGLTYSTNFPVTGDAYQPANLGAALTTTNAFLTILNPAVGGSGGLEYSTYLGGSGNPALASAVAQAAGDIGTDITLDGNGNIWLVGESASTWAYNPPGFPVTPNAFQADNNNVALGFPSGANFFVSEFSNLPSPALEYSTYLGGQGSVLTPSATVMIPLGDYGTGIRVDSSGTPWITGAVTSLGTFPSATAGNGCFATNNPNDFFSNPVLVSLSINPTSSSIDFETFLPGDIADAPLGIDLDPAGDIYLTGLTYSSPLTSTSNPNGFPITTNAYETINRAFLNHKGLFGSTTNAFLTQIDSTSATCILEGSLVITPPKLTFKGAGVGVGQTQSITISNPGPGSLGINVAQMTPPFTVTAGLGESVIPQGGTAAISVNFMPQQAKPAAARMAITTSAPRKINVTVPVSGKGAPGKLAGPRVIKFPATPIGTPAQMTVTYTNAGAGILGATVGQPTGAYTIISGGGATQMSPGAALNVEIQFTPAKKGPNPGKLFIQTTDPNAKVPVALSGIGTP